MTEIVVKITDAFVTLSDQHGEAVIWRKREYEGQPLVLGQILGLIGQIIEQGPTAYLTRSEPPPDVPGRKVTAEEMAEANRRWAEALDRGRQFLEDQGAEAVTEVERLLKSDQEGGP